MTNEEEAKIKRSTEEPVEIKPDLDLRNDLKKNEKTIEKTE
jgi:hypothetical protein